MAGMNPAASASAPAAAMGRLWPGMKLLAVKVVIRASSSHPTTSFTAAEAIAMTPTLERARFSSSRIRPRVGNAVMENAVATNSAEFSRAAGAASPGAVR